MSGSSPTPRKRIKLSRNEIRIPSIETFKKRTEYSQPKEVAKFSFDFERRLLLNSRASLGYLQKKKLPLDLNEGYPEKYVKRSNEPEGITSLLESVKDVDLEVDVLTWRGIITKILCTPYDTTGWHLEATLHKGCIYMQECEEEGVKLDRFGETDMGQLFCYYGYKFESMLTNGSPDGSAPEDGEVNTNVQYCSVFKSKLGKHNILMGGEVDCLYKTPSDSNFQREYTELKTHKIMTSPHQVRSFTRYKLLKTWAQSFLCGVRRVIFGFRDKNGFIKNVKEYQTSEFPRMARKESLWDPHVCLTFGDWFFDELQRAITIDDPNTVYRINCENGKISFERMEERKCFISNIL